MDDAQRRAQERMTIRSVDESRMSMEGQTNAGGMVKTYDNGTPYYDPAPLTEYPRMLYRATFEEERVQQTDEHAKCGETWLVVNNYGTQKEPLLCETRIVQDATEAEEASMDGWEISARAAHGLADGLAKQASAKDDRIAELEAQLAAAQSKRGPGRPPKSPEEQPETA